MAIVLKNRELFIGHQTAVSGILWHSIFPVSFADTSSASEDVKCGNGGWSCDEDQRLRLRLYLQEQPYPKLIHRTFHMLISSSLDDSLIAS